MRFILVLIATLSVHTYSAPYNGSGKIADILVRDSLDAYAIIYVSGFSEAGDCPKYPAKNLVILSVKNDDNAQPIYSMALAAYMAEKPIKIVVDNSVKDADGNCLIKDIRLNPSF